MNIEFTGLSKNLQMNIQIYLYWGNGTNTNKICRMFYLNIQIFKYLCSSLLGVRCFEDFKEKDDLLSE